MKTFLLLISFFFIVALIFLGFASVHSRENTGTISINIEIPEKILRLIK